MSELTVSILIVSDTASQDTSQDKTGDVLSTVFDQEGQGRWKLIERQIVRDDIQRIQHAVRAWCDGSDAVNLILTSGGTGFAVRDVTPEAISPLLRRHASGLVHGMLAASLVVTPFAMMSRPVAGVRNGTLIITLPGSPKGAKENLLAVLKLLPHACMQAAGKDSRTLHAGGMKKLEADAGIVKTAAPKGNNQSNHHHHHHHGPGSHTIPRAHTQQLDRPVSNDPSAGAIARQRTSPYPMISVDAALELIYSNCPDPVRIKAPINSGIIRHVVADDVTAKESVPAFRASVVDGYAIIVSTEADISNKGVFPVASVSHASAGSIPPLEKGQIARITTGAPLPPNANAVIMVEDTVVKTKTAQADEEETVEILTDDKITSGENVREVGSDIKTGHIILKQGQEISAVGGEIGLLASTGNSETWVYKKPTVGVLSTGDEIIPHDRQGPLRLGEVRDCNRPVLIAAIKGWGYETIDLGIASDAVHSLETELRSSLKRADVIVTSGGVSMGELDLLKPTIERSLGATIHFGRVDMKPGKPTTFATVPVKDDQGIRGSVGKPIFALPGNPASALVSAHLFILPCLQKMSGKPSPWGLPRVRAELMEDVRCDPARPEYHRVSLAFSTNGVLRAVSTGGQRSSRIGSLSNASGLLCLPVGGEILKKGAMVDSFLMGDLRGY